jgi:hypothetical protein
VQGVPGVGEVVAAFGDAGELGECLGRVGFEELDEGIEEGGAFGVVFVGGVAGAGVEVVGAEDAHDADGGQGGHVDDALLVARLGFVVAGGDFDFGLDLELHVGREDGAGAGVAFLEGVAAGGAFAGLGGGAVGFLAVFAGGGLLCGGGVAGHGVVLDESRIGTRVERTHGRLLALLRGRNSGTREGFRPDEGRKP